MATELVDQFGCELFGTQADITTFTDWTTSGSWNIVTRNIFNITDEKWMEMNNFDFVRRTFSGENFAIINGTQREFEFSCHWYHLTGNPTSVNNILMELSCGAGAGKITLETGLDFNTTLNRKIDIRADYAAVGGDPDEEFKTDLLLQAGKLFYFTIRMRAESASGASDGKWQVWCNEELIQEKTGVNWTSLGPQSAFEGTVFANANCPNQMTIDVRNLTIHSGWTTADGVAPTHKHVFDVHPDVGVGTFTDYTNEGGAAGFPEAVGDGLDTTYIRSDVASAQAEFIINPPTELVGKDITDAKVSIDAGRESADMNDIDLELANSAGTQLNTVNTVLAAVAPARERIDLFVSSPVAESADNLKVRVTNGS